MSGSFLSGACSMGQISMSTSYSFSVVSFPLGILTVDTFEASSNSRSDSSLSFLPKSFLLILDLFFFLPQSSSNEE